MALLVDENGNITETASSNIILVENLGKSASSWVFHTPKIGSTLPGITQQLLKEFALEHGFQWVERDINQTEIRNEFGGILSCTSYCFAEVNSIGKTCLNPSSKVLDLIAIWWERRFGLDWRKQILNIL
jgi:branched-subunit amino acid aminotransferase/4-amino-4-deoxychorismate lyase